MKIIISNASPLIALARAGLFHLLKDLYQRIFIPDEVYQEVVVRGTGRPGGKEVQSADWITTETVRDEATVQRVRIRGLKRAEAEAIALAIEKNADLLLVDDRKARQVAQAEGVKITGTLGLLLEAKERGLITSVRKHMEILEQCGLSIDPELRNRVLQIAGE